MPAIPRCLPATFTTVPMTAKSVTAGQIAAEAALALIAALSRNPVPKRHDGFALKPFGVVAANVDGLLPLLRSAPITLVNGVLSDNDRKTELPSIEGRDATRRRSVRYFYGNPTFRSQFCNNDQILPCLGRLSVIVINETRQQFAGI